jgi:Flp pilus assembly protein TadG
MKSVLKSGWRDERASQIVEFAASLPILILFVVGIFDFSGAFTLKHKLANAAREGARAAAAGPANDLGSPAARVPASVGDALQVVDNYLLNAKVDDCGLSTVTAAAGSDSLSWVYTANSCTGPGTLTLTINRGYYFPAQTPTQPAAISCHPQTPNGQITLMGTCVSIQYPYAWRYGRVASLIGSSSALSATFTTTAVALNEN